MTRLSASNAVKFANARFKEAQKGVAATSLLAIKTVATPVQKTGNAVAALLRLRKLKGVIKKPRL